MLKQTQELVKIGRQVKEVRIVVDELFIDVTIDQDDEPEPPPGARSPPPRRNEKPKFACLF